MMDQTTPEVYKAVRAVGTFKPKFNPSEGKIFADELNVIGTAFWLKTEKVLITCAHVIQDLIGPLEITGLLVVGNAGNYRRAVVDIIDVQHDLAVLRLIGNNNQPIHGQELDAEANDGLLFIDRYPNVSTGVAYVGFPHGNQLLNSIHSPTYSEGVIGVEKKEGPIRKEIQISGSVVGGFSGSPVVLKDDTTKIIGVVSNGPNVNPDSGASIFMAISWEHMKALAQLSKS